MNKKLDIYTLEVVRKMIKNMRSCTSSVTVNDRTYYGKRLDAYKFQDKLLLKIDKILIKEEAK